MEYTKIQQLTVGKEFVEHLQEVGFVTYVVVSNDGFTVNARSIYRDEYDFELTQEDLDLRRELDTLRIYDTRESAKKDYEGKQ